MSQSGRPIPAWCLWLALAAACAQPPAGDTGSSDSPTDTEATVASTDTEGADCASVDLDSDPLNCGQCGRTCVIPHAEALCVEGACVQGTCELGWADCDGELATGCEDAVDCADASPCASTCGTTGALSCADPCAPVCQAPAELCNAMDDDCDGSCDQGAIPGCRVAVHRAFNGVTGHLFTTDLAEAQLWGLERADNFFLYTAAAADLRPWFRCRKANLSVFFTESNDCEGTGGPRSTLGFIAPQPGVGADATCGAVPLYRIHNPANNWHFYTLSVAERDAAIGNGWVDQGLAGYVWLAP